MFAIILTGSFIGNNSKLKFYLDKNLQFKPLFKKMEDQLTTEHRSELTWFSSYIQTKEWLIRNQEINKNKLTLVKTEDGDKEIEIRNVKITYFRFWRTPKPIFSKEELIDFLKQKHISGSYYVGITHFGNLISLKEIDTTRRDLLDCFAVLYGKAININDWEEDMANQADYLYLCLLYAWKKYILLGKDIRIKKPVVFSEDHLIRDLEEIREAYMDYNIEKINNFKQKAGEIKEDSLSVKTQQIILDLIWNKSTDSISKLCAINDIPTKSKKRHKKETIELFIKCYNFCPTVEFRFLTKVLKMIEKQDISKINKVLYAIENGTFDIQELNKKIHDSYVL